jgi:hypothetical protein
MGMDGMMMRGIVPLGSTVLLRVFQNTVFSSASAGGIGAAPSGSASTPCLQHSMCPLARSLSVAAAAVSLIKN